MRPPSWPGWLASRTAGAALFGFALSLLSAFGAAFWLDPAQDAQDRAAREAILSAARARAIFEANAFDDLATDVGALAFSVSLPPDMNEEAANTVREIRRRALHRQRDGVRGYLALLGVAGAIDYAAERARFEKLVEAENVNYTLDTFGATNAFEADLAMAMVKAQGTAAIKAIRLERDRREAKAIVAERRLRLLGLSLAGLTVLFVVAMAGASNQRAPAPPGPSRRLLWLARDRLAARAKAKGEAE